MSWMRSGTKLSQFLRDFLPTLSMGPKLLTLLPSVVIQITSLISPIISNNVINVSYVIRPILASVGPVCLLFYFLLQNIRQNWPTAIKVAT